MPAPPPHETHASAAYPGHGNDRRASADVLRQAFGHLDAIALGGALGIVCGLVLFTATNILVLKGGESVGFHLGLLSQYLPGYRVTALGSVLGALYAFALGSVLGWGTAFLRNSLLDAYLWLIKLWANLSRTYFLDRFD